MLSPFVHPNYPLLWWRPLPPNLHCRCGPARRRTQHVSQSPMATHPPGPGSRQHVTGPRPSDSGGSRLAGAGTDDPMCSWRGSARDGTGSGLSRLRPADPRMDMTWTRCLSAEPAFVTCPAAQPAAPTFASLSPPAGCPIGTVQVRTVQACSSSTGWLCARHIK